MRTKKGKTVILFCGDSGIYNAAIEHEKNIVGTRILEARKKSGLNLNQLSDRLTQHGVNVTGGAISKWELGKAMPNPYQLLAVCHSLGIADPLQYFSESYQPVLNAEGLRKVSEYTNDLVASGRYRTTALPRVETKYVDMPVSNLRASAGTGALLDEGSFDTLRFPASEIPIGADFGVRVSGDSMEPIYHDGQIVWVERCNELNPGEVGIVIYDGEGYIKLYQEQEASGDSADCFTDSYGMRHPQPVLVSYNESYAPKIILPNTRFQIVGRVL